MRPKEGLHSQQLGEETVENPVTPTHRQLVETRTSDLEDLPFSCHLGEEFLGCIVQFQPTDKSWELILLEDLHTPIV